MAIPVFKHMVDIFSKMGTIFAENASKNSYFEFRML